MSKEDRMGFGATTGAYYFCFYAYTDFSASMKVTEYVVAEDQNNNYDLTAGQVSTQLLSRSNPGTYFRYTDSAIGQGRSGNVTVYLEVQAKENDL
jgi:hypothetical protein